MSLIGPEDLAALITAAVVATGEGDPADPLSLRDVLWLAAVIGPDEVAGQEQPSGAITTSALAGGKAQPEVHPGDKQETADPAAQPQGQPQPAARLFDVSDQVSGYQNGRIRARPVSLAGPTALRGKLELARALRPFRQTAPSRHQHVLDVEATIRASAATGRTLPVLRPAAERRFSADLVFDSSPSMMVWDDTFDELAGIFQHVGAFREVTKWRLHADQERDDIWLTDRNGYRRPPTVLRSADRRRVVLVMTDGVGEHWYAPAIWACLTDWGSSGPTALVDPLPLKLWNLSGIGPDRVRVRASSAGVANVDLRYNVPRIPALGRPPAARSVPVPVSEFSSAALTAWAATVGDAHPDGCVAVLTPSQSPVTAAISRTGDADSEASLSNFILTASEAALRLAVLAAVSPSTSLAVLRAIQEELLPDSSTSDLAEVLVSGIYRRLPGGDAEADLRIRMDPGCRARLQKRSSAQDRWDVYRAVTSTIARRYPGSARGFLAAVQDPWGPLLIPAGQQAFAEVARSALAQARLGNRSTVLFLSYAEEDRHIASEIARVLEGNAFEVFRWEKLRQQDRQFIKQTEDAIERSDAYLALLSPSFLATDWSRRERDIAIRREARLKRNDRDRRFVHVLQIAPTPISDAGLLGSYDWLDLTSSANREESLYTLIAQIHDAAGRRPVSGQRRAAIARPGQASPVFRDRAEELERVLSGLTNANGPHFWLVIAPPQLGKTWFMRRVAADVGPGGTSGWVTKLVDLREQPIEARTSPSIVLGLLSGDDPPMMTGAEVFQRIAQQIIRSRRPHLWLLDSADLMDRQAAATLRARLSQVYRLVQDAGNIDVRLGLIVASSHERGEWRGVTPAPRLSPLPLTEFRIDVVQAALRDLGLQMNRTFSAPYYAQNALLVHRLTQGLPSLLARCLDWIRENQWLGMERLETQDLFEEITGSYVRNELLSPHDQEYAPMSVLAHTLRVLAPYRFFTQSHLRYYLESDADFNAAVREQGWVTEDLWNALNGTSLLLRPLAEPWQQIYPAIRRLLYQHYYTSQEQRVRAHREAAQFVEIWADRQTGKEQVVGLVERLWHEANVLRMSDPADMEQRLIESARKLSRGLLQSSAYTLNDLRDYAAERIRDDEELQEAVSIAAGLFDRLVDIVARPL